MSNFSSGPPQGMGGAGFGSPQGGGNAPGIYPALARFVGRGALWLPEEAPDKLSHSRRVRGAAGGARRRTLLDCWT